MLRGMIEHKLAKEMVVVVAVAVAFPCQLSQKCNFYVFVIGVPVCFVIPELGFCVKFSFMGSVNHAFQEMC